MSRVNLDSFLLALKQLGIRRQTRPLVVVLGAAIAMTGCHTDLWVQPKVRPQDESDFFADGASNRPLVPGTLARDHLREDEAFFTGFKNGKLVTELPMKVT